MTVWSSCDIDDPHDARLDNFRDLNRIDRRPDLPSGKGLVIAEGVLVVQRMLHRRLHRWLFLGTDRRLAELKADLAGNAAPYYRVSAEVMAQAVGFHLNRGVLAAARRAPERTVADVIDSARTVAVLEGVNDHETWARSSATRRGSTSTPSCSAAAAPIRCTGVRCAFRWGTPYCAVCPRSGLAERLEGTPAERVSAAGNDPGFRLHHTAGGDDDGA